MAPKLWYSTHLPFLRLLQSIQMSSSLAFAKRDIFPCNFRICCLSQSSILGIPLYSNHSTIFVASYLSSWTPTRAFAFVQMSLRLGWTWSIVSETWEGPCLILHLVTVTLGA